MSINLKKLLKSFRYAVRGIGRVMREEQNFRLQFAIAAFLFVLMFSFPLSGAERGVLTLAAALVLVLELMNSVLERIADLLKPRLHDMVEEIKDIMAGSVLVAALGALATGFAVFWPHLAALWRQ